MENLNPVDVWAYVQVNPWTSAVFILLVLSEALASIPVLKANSVFQLVTGLVKKLARKE